jgi:hypothetical protein
MTEALSFGANGCIESCKCDKKFWIYHQQDKGRNKNLINQTKMTKIRDIIEKIWWVIPPIIVVFGIPLYRAVKQTLEPSVPLNWFIALFGTHLSFMIEYLTALYGTVAIFFFGFMGIGYYLVRKQPSLLRRIIIVSVLGIIGWIVGMFALLIIGGGAH